MLSSAAHVMDRGRMMAKGMPTFTRAQAAVLRALAEQRSVVVFGHPGTGRRFVLEAVALRVAGCVVARNWGALCRALLDPGTRLVVCPFGDHVPWALVKRWLIARRAAPRGSGAARARNAAAAAATQVQFLALCESEHLAGEVRSALQWLGTAYVELVDFDGKHGGAGGGRAAAAAGAVLPGDGTFRTPAHLSAVKAIQRACAAGGGGRCEGGVEGSRDAAAPSHRLPEQPFTSESYYVLRAVAELPVNDKLSAHGAAARGLTALFETSAEADRFIVEQRRTEDARHHAAPLHWAVPSLWRRVYPLAVVDAELRFSCNKLRYGTTLLLAPREATCERAAAERVVHAFHRLKFDSRSATNSNSSSSSIADGGGGSDGPLFLAAVAPERARGSLLCRVGELDPQRAAAAWQRSVEAPGDRTWMGLLPPIVRRALELAGNPEWELLRAIPVAHESRLLLAHPPWLPATAAREVVLGQDSPCFWDRAASELTAGGGAAQVRQRFVRTHVVGFTSDATLGPSKGHSWLQDERALEHYTAVTGIREWPVVRVVTAEGALCGEVAVTPRFTTLRGAYGYVAEAVGLPLRNTDALTIREAAAMRPFGARFHVGPLGLSCASLAGAVSLPAEADCSSLQLSEPVPVV